MDKDALKTDRGLDMQTTKQVFKNPYFLLEWNEAGNGLAAIRRYGGGMNYLASDKGRALGTVCATAVNPDGRESDKAEAKSDFRFSKTDEQELIWEITVRNGGEEPLVIENLKLPLQMNTVYEADAKINYTERLVRHAYISGNASVLYWQKPDGTFPALVMLCGEGTGLVDCELDSSDRCPGWFGTYSVSIHAKESDRNALYPNPKDTETRLEPGKVRVFRFLFRWAESYADIRNIVYAAGRPDVISLPGMVVPSGMDCLLGVRVRSGYTMEFPEGVTGRKLDARNGYDVYSLSFEKTGRYLVGVDYTGGRAYLDYFATEGIEELLRIRSRHVASFQQYRGEAWYDGLISLWNMETEKLITPDYREGIFPYCTGGADDPGLCKASVIAAKNCHYPVREEIEAVEYYMEHFLWGGLQRRDDEEPYPYGIYGSDYWYDNRRSPVSYDSGGHGGERMWRTFDYTHIIGLYRDMYRIARKFPELTSYLDWRGYLLRAYRTAMAFYEVPYSIFMKNGWAHHGYCDWAFKQGNFHEINIPWLIDDLEREGYPEEAAALRRYWEQKVMYMLEIHPYPFGSEMWFDSTAFESTHVIAEYGLTHALPVDLTFYDKNKNGPGEGGEIAFAPVSRETVWQFMEKQIRANLADRGCLEPTFYHMGCDVRQEGDCEYLLSYMSQLGGRSVLDYALNYAGRRDEMAPGISAEEEPYPDEMSSIWMRTGYASYLSSFMLINTGADYPWYGKEINRGAAGWAFEPLQKGRTFFPNLHDVNNAPWPYDGEIDNGFIGAMRTACSVFYRDDVFGYVFLGGHTEEIAPGKVRLVPADGLRQRFHFRGDFGLSLLAKGLRIEHFDWDLGGGTIRVCLEEIPEEKAGRISIETRGCAAELIRAGEGIRPNGNDRKGTGFSAESIGDAGKDAYWLEFAVKTVSE